MENIQLTAAEVAALKNGEVPATVIEKLPKPTVPPSWESLRTLNGFYVSAQSDILSLDIDMTEDNRNTFATKSLALSHGIAAAQIEQLIAAMYGFEKAKELRKDMCWKIVSEQSSIRVIEYMGHHLLSFETLAHAEQFLNTHRKLIMKYYAMEGGEL